MRDTLDFAVILKHETERAYLVDIGEPNPVWLPKLNDGKGGIIRLPYWLAYERGMI